MKVSGSLLAAKFYHPGFGKSVITRSNLAKANAIWDYKNFEEFAYEIIAFAKKQWIERDF